MEKNLDDVKLCVDCKYLSDGGFNLCHSPKNGFSVVDGTPKPVMAVVSRSNRVWSLHDQQHVEMCGPEGKFFEPRESVHFIKRMFWFWFKK